MINAIADESVNATVNETANEIINGRRIRHIETRYVLQQPHLQT